MRATLNCTIENSIIVRDVTKRKALNQLKIPPSPVWALEVVVQRQKGGTPKKRVLALWHTKKERHILHISNTFLIFTSRCLFSFFNQHSRRRASNELYVLSGNPTTILRFHVNPIHSVIISKPFILNRSSLLGDILIIDCFFFCWLHCRHKSF